MDQPERVFVGLANLVETLTPWLLDVGSWIFGGLIAINLVMISPLLAVGAVDAAVKAALAAIACALPLSAAGLLLLRLIKDANDVGFDGATRQAFQDAGIAGLDAYLPPPGRRVRRAHIVLIYVLAMAALSVAATLAGLVAALWHMAWWIGLLLLVMAVLSAALVAAGLAHAMPPDANPPS